MEEFKEIFDKYLNAQKAGDTKKLSMLYQELVIARNTIAVNQGYANYLDMKIKKINRIPEPHWQKYLAGKYNFADKYSARVINSPYSPHFLSALPYIGMKFPSEVIEYVAKKYSEIDKVRNNITIEGSDKGAYFKYSKENDHYSIFISETNLNQKISMLIHELAHVVSQEKHDHKVEGFYTAELEAHQVELDLAKDISEQFSRAVIGEYLMCLVRTDFQIAMFENPSLNPIDTYENCFAKYIGRLNEKNQTDFLSDRKITHLPLEDLSSAVSLVNLLT
jgi:hypothetical protein